MRVTECEAIVLSVRDYGDADKIVRLFTREHGKVAGIARGARKSRKRFGGSLEIFARLRLQIVLKEGLSRLDSIDSLSVFPHIREDLAKIGHAGYACELIDRLLPEELPNARLYRLAASYLEYLDSSPARADERRFFEVNLLNIIGYRLPLEFCAQCRAALSGAASPLYRAASGEFFCGRCGAAGEAISPATISLLRMAMGTGRFGKIRFAAGTLREAGEVLDAAIASHLDRPLSSLSFLREVL